MRFTALLLIAIAMPATRPAQAQVHTIRGSVVDANDGAPLAGVNVFLLETLDGAMSDSLGRFSFTAQVVTGTIVARKIGFLEYRSPLTAGSLRIALEPAILLPALHVAAGRFTAGNGPDVELNTLEVVRTPGAAADVFRALQTFPGLQAADEGAGLFVRGGDVNETRIIVNDAVVLSPYRYESPTGGFFGAFDPFLLDGINFSSGGFGARYGDALSGVAALNTLGRPDGFGGGATASLAALSGTVDVPLGGRTGARATYTRSHTGLLFRVNGTTTDFTDVPEGRDASLIASAEYGDGGEVKLFALDQWSRLGVFLDEPSFDGSLSTDSHHDAQVLTWRHSPGSVRSRLTVARAASRSTLDFGALDLTLDDRLDQANGSIEIPVSARVRVSAGGEVAWRTAGFTGTVPRAEHDVGPEATVNVIDYRADGTRTGLFIESDWTARPGLRLILGVRSDHSSLTDRTTLDPRIALAFSFNQLVTLTAAWGHYHQVPDPRFHDPAFGGANLGAMSAEHRVIGMQAGDEESLLLRVELYWKRYAELAQFTRSGHVHRGGVGESRGADVFLRWPEWRGWSGRMSWSGIDATRTDPNTGQLARSPFDITHVFTSVLGKTFGQAWQLSVAARHGSGRPVTPILDAAHDPASGTWVPRYGVAYSERLPSFHRIDASLDRLFFLPHNRIIVAFLAVNNLFDRKNINDYRYSQDYATREAVRSQFNRSVYFGATLQF